MLNARKIEVIDSHWEKSRLSGHRKQFCLVTYNQWNCCKCSETFLSVALSIRQCKHLTECDCFIHPADQNKMPHSLATVLL